MVRNLQEELQRSGSRQINTLRFQENIQAKNRTLTFENKSLKDNNLKLVEEVRLLREQNSNLERVSVCVCGSQCVFVCVCVWGGGGGGG